MPVDITQIAPKMKPWVIRWINELGLATGTGAPSPHALTSEHHTGSVSDAQIPQALLADGSRQLTGSLAVAAGATIDGVDVSAHAANPSAHHAPVGAADTSLAVVGQQLNVHLASTSGLAVASGLQLADSVAGAGLSIASKVLNVVAADTSLTVNPDSLGVRLAAASGLAVSNGLMLADSVAGVGLGISDKVLTVNTSNGLELAGDAVRVNQGYAFNWTAQHTFSPESVAAPFVLGANAQGQKVTGLNADLLDGLNTNSNTFASPQAYVLVSDSQGVLTLKGLGVNCNRDPQFQVDIGGNLRAQGWIVGKHAIQLSGAKCIAHFDGQPPVNGDYTGNPTGHMGQTAMTYGRPLYVAGTFGKGVQCAIETTNYVKNPSLEDSWTDWSVAGSASLSAIREHVKYGAAALRVTTASASTQSGAIANTITGLGGTGQTYTGSAWVWVTGSEGTHNPVDFWLRFVYTDSSNSDSSHAVVQPGEGWQRVTVTGTASAGKTLNYVQVHFRVMLSGQTRIFYVDAAQVERKSYATPFVDATMPGVTVNADGSVTRSIGHLIYNRTIVNPDVGTVMLHYQPASGYATGAVEPIFNVGDPYDSGYAFLRAYKGADNLFRLQIKDGESSSGTIYNPIAPFAWQWQAGDDLCIAVTWQSAVSITAYLYRNGVLEYSGTTAIGTMPLAWASSYGFGVGFGYQVATGNGVIDELVTLDREATADEIRAVIESGAPVFAETSVWGWSQASRRVWADEKGLWGIDGLDRPSLAFCAVDGEPWGGQTLDMGDVLLGRESSFLKWDASAGAAYFSGDGSQLTNLDGTAISNPGAITGIEGGAIVNGQNITVINGGAIQTGTVTANAIAAGSIKTNHLEVGTASRLITNWKDGTTAGWGLWNGAWNNPPTIAVQRDGYWETALNMTTTGNMWVTNEAFEVDPNATYQFAVTLRADNGQVAGMRYFGLIVYDAAGNNIGAWGMEVGGTVWGAVNTNGYFWYGNLPTPGQYVDIIGYLCGCNTSPSEAPYGKNAIFVYKMPHNARRAQMRILNYDNAGTNVAVYAMNPSVVRVGTSRIHGNLIVDGTLTADKLSATAIDGKTITGATLRTSATVGQPGGGAGVLINSAGVAGYTASSDQGFNISAATGLAQMGAGDVKIGFGGVLVDLAGTKLESNAGYKFGLNGSPRGGLQCHTYSATSHEIELYSSFYDTDPSTRVVLTAYGLASGAQIALIGSNSVAASIQLSGNLYHYADNGYWGPGHIYVPLVDRYTVYEDQTFTGSGTIQLGLSGAVFPSSVRGVEVSLYVKCTAPGEGAYFFLGHESTGNDRFMTGLFATLSTFLPRGGTCPTPYGASNFYATYNANGGTLTVRLHITGYYV